MNDKKMSDATAYTGIAFGLMTLAIGLTGIGKDSLAVLSIVLMLGIAHVVCAIVDIERNDGNDNK